jgi:hypothetical protein
MDYLSAPLFTFILKLPVNTVIVANLSSPIHIYKFSYAACPNC